MPTLSSGLGCPEILGLALPRPNMVWNNRPDQLFTLPGMERANQNRFLFDKQLARQSATAD